VKPEVVKLDIDATSTIFWNGEAVPDREALEGYIARAANMGVQPEVHLRPDKGAKYAVVAGVMASAQRLGLTKIGIVGSEQFIND
jgi:biopolymer transport protein ExbD